jgi:hypothetical protein
MKHVTAGLIRVISAMCTLFALLSIVMMSMLCLACCDAPTTSSAYSSWKSRCAVVIVERFSCSPLQLSCMMQVLVIIMHCSVLQQATARNKFLSTSHTHLLYVSVCMMKTCILCHDATTAQ